ncbi:ion channel [Flectobacillus major]|jgi:inward rectifier potassium channel|uniref:ion channel n=1 Tax=Flectobacillus major TaxID=103 RepID=UPI0003FC9E21|nr:ion channel [Flectobacillus major]
MAFKHYRNDKYLQAEENRQELGFGKQINTNTRLINKDGSFNVKRIGGSFWSQINIYHRLITCSWYRFFMVVVIYFIVVNLLFATTYNLIGMEFLHGADISTPTMRFMDAFFFSAQTLTTVGYGRIAPTGLLMSTVASVESLLGLMGFAIATGLLYGRFSRPIAFILYSEQAVIAPYLDMTGLMFRIVNERANQIIDLSVEVNLSVLETDETGKKNRTYTRLHLERSRVNFFPGSWTIVHPITDDSPIFGLTQEQLLEKQAELLVLIKGTEDTFNQTVHSRNSYHAREIVYGAKFKSMFSDISDTGMVHLDLRKLSQTFDVPLASPLFPEVEEENSTEKPK